MIALTKIYKSQNPVKSMYTENCELTWPILTAESCCFPYCFVFLDGRRGLCRNWNVRTRVIAKVGKISRKDNGPEKSDLQKSDVSSDKLNCKRRLNR